MGRIYDIESELRDLCKDFDNNGNIIYLKLRELSGRLIARNTSMLGPDVNRDTLPHEISSYIIVQIKSGKLEAVSHWSGYIRKILPRMIKTNAEYHSPQYIDTLGDGIDIVNVLNMNYAGSIGIINEQHARRVLNDLPNLPRTIDGWVRKNVRCVEIDSSTFGNIHTTILLSLLSGRVVLYRLPKHYESQIIVYLNKLKIYLARMLLSDRPASTYDQIRAISDIESLEEVGGTDCD